MIDVGGRKLVVHAGHASQEAYAPPCAAAATLTKIPASADIVRLARASGGRIALAAGPNGLVDWQKIMPTIAAAPSAVSHYSALALDLTGLAGAIDACLLRLLDQRIRSALASHHCDTLGPINASIAGAIGPTWTAWHASLTADKALLDAFLRWLANVEQHEHTRWNGDHARISHLATALVMMLATDHSGGRQLGNTGANRRRRGRRRSRSGASRIAGASGRNRFT